MAPPVSTTHESLAVILEQTAPESASRSTVRFVAVLPISSARRARNKSASMTQETTVPHPRELIVAVPVSSSMDAHLLHLLLKPKLDIPFTLLIILFEHQRSDQKRYWDYCITGARAVFFLESCQLDIFSVGG